MRPQGSIPCTETKTTQKELMKDNNSKLEGVVSAHPKGFGFVTTEDGAEHFVSPPLMRELLPGDKIRFTVEAGKRPGSFQVAEPRIVHREPSVWQGVLRQDQGSWVLDCDQPCFVRIEVADMQFVADGLVVSVRVPGFSSSGTRGGKVQARLERVLGERTRTGFDADYALARFDFEPYFHASALAQCKDLSVPEIAGRADLTHIPYVTVDGEMTRDFDDAVWGEVTDYGWLLSVAIADVSYYVRADSVLDKVAQRRSTSVYLPGKTVPMLPEALSNGVCSLLPGERRLAVVLDIHLSTKGQVLKTELRRGTIRSAQRLTYAEAFAWKQGTFSVPEKVHESLAAMWSAYEVLAKLRQARGQLEFDDREPKLEVSAAGAVTLGWSQRNDSHKLVEELMLLANQCVAQRLRGVTGSAFFRHQPTPDAEDWTRLKEWAQSKGMVLPEEPSMRALSDLIAGFSGEEVLKAELQVRNGMQPAIYDESLASHFSLGYEAYAHFTSPIRRYADLLVHRLLLGECNLSDSHLADVASHCSRRSRDARMAERSVWDKLKKRAMARDTRPDQVLVSHVVSQSRRGLRVVVAAWQCSVLLSSEELMDAGYRFDDDKEAWGQAGALLEPGSLLQIRLSRLEEDRSRTELHAQLC